METISKELLDQPAKPSILETLLLGSKDPASKPQKNRHRDARDAKGGLFTTAVCTSHVLGKVKDFIGAMAEANKKLELDAEGNSRANFDIEVLSGSEQEHIEMDLLLGVADLHSAEAVAAAEASMGRSQQPTSTSCSCSGTDDGSDDDGDDEVTTGHHTDKFKKPKSGEDGSLTSGEPSKRPKIVELD